MHFFLNFSVKLFNFNKNLNFENNFFRKSDAFLRFSFFLFFFDFRKNLIAQLKERAKKIFQKFYQKYFLLGFFNVLWHFF